MNNALSLSSCLGRCGVVSASLTANAKRRIRTSSSRHYFYNLTPSPATESGHSRRTLAYQLPERVLIRDSTAVHVNKLLPPWEEVQGKIQNAQDFSKVVEGAGISRIAFLCSGNAHPSRAYDFEFNRPLTERGRKNVRHIGHLYADELKPFFHIAVMSGAVRTIESAQIFLEGADVPQELVQRRPFGTGYDATLHSYAYVGPRYNDRDWCQKGADLFNRISQDVPLENYLIKQRATDRKITQSVLGFYAQVMLEHVYFVASRCQGIGTGEDTLLFMGHRVYTSAAALAAALLTEADDAALQRILTTPVLSAEGFLVGVGLGNYVRCLTRPIPTVADTPQTPAPKKKEKVWVREPGGRNFERSYLDPKIERDATAEEITMVAEEFQNYLTHGRIRSDALRAHNAELLQQQAKDFIKAQKKKK